MRYAQQEEARGGRSKKKKRMARQEPQKKGKEKKRAPRHSPRGSNLSRNPDRGGRAHEVGGKKAEWINIYSELMGLESRSPSRGGTRGRAVTMGTVSSALLLGDLSYTYLQNNFKRGEEDRE